MPDFWSIIGGLEKYYGKPALPETRDAFELLLYEKSAYLTSEDRRIRAFRELKKSIGTKPIDILVAAIDELSEITAIGGIYAELRARRMAESARLVRDEFGGSLRAVLKLPFKDARKALQKFPMIGEPGAEKILLFTGSHPCLGLDSNGLRVLVRMGFAKEEKNYSTMYRRVMDAVSGELGEDCNRLLVAHQLLKRHGQEIC